MHLAAATGSTDAPPAAAGDDPRIRIRGARTHNLREIDVDIPRDQLVVITGPSGSGKSSLAFDTLFAEGQRQYIESLSVYARQFLHQLERPDVDLIDGLQPTLCIDQRPGAHSPRSTVATITEIYDYLRLLVARAGEARCYQCGGPIRQLSLEQIAASLLALPEGTKAMLLAPLVRGRKGKHDDVLANVRKAGFVRVRIDGEVYDLDKAPELEPRKNHHLDAVVDRIVIRPGIEGRLAESVRLAEQHGEGLVTALYLRPEAPPGGWREDLFSTRYACPDCQISYEELEPRTFSFNSPYGACPTCEGLGVLVEFDPELALPDRTLSLAAGALAPWRGLPPAAQRRLEAQLAPLLAAHQIDRDQPIGEWSAVAWEKFWRGDGKKLPGVLTLLERECATTTRPARLAQLEAFRGKVTCPACEGSRLRPEARSVQLAGRAIHEVTRLSIGDARRFFAELSFPSALAPIAAPLVSEIARRLAFLEKVGVDYLSLDRPGDTLSGGEHQRVRLAASIGSGLVGVCYVLDEPSIGLHQRDNQRLIDALRDLQQQGNTVLVVEHDEAMMRQADWLIDMGPGAGSEGGRIVAQGPPADVARQQASLTGQFLAGGQSIALPPRRRRVAKSRAIALEGCTHNNLRDVSVMFPLGALVCVTGVSGSGKSSLVNETLAPALLRRLGQAAPKPGAHTSLRGASQVDKVIQVDQTPIGRTPRSNAATYTGVFDEIRKVFAATRESRQRGYRLGRFSFNVKGGRCEACQGQGVRRIEMNFLPDLYLACDECGGARFNRQTLEVRHRGLNIADVLALPVREAREFFANFPAIERLLHGLDDVGLGYLPLGQASTTLSGGEAQRIKLATELARVDTGGTLYLLDEPTSGLHFDDIRKLLAVLDRLVERGNTVIVIEHNLDVIKCADWLIDLGPEGGAGGGRLLAAGPPEELAALPDNATGQFLRPLFDAPPS